MRNPKRIKTFCDVLAGKWEHLFPDWRFGQFMSNFLGYVYSQAQIDIFFIEDDEMLDYLKEYLEDRKSEEEAEDGAE